LKNCHVLRVNPQIFEPVIQIMYEVKLRLIRAPKKEKVLKKPKILTKTVVKKKVLLIIIFRYNMKIIS